MLLFTDDWQSFLIHVTGHFVATKFRYSFVLSRNGTKIGSGVTNDIYYYDILNWWKSIFCLIGFIENHRWIFSSRQQRGSYWVKETSERNMTASRKIQIYQVGLKMQHFLLLLTKALVHSLGTSGLNLWKIAILEPWKIYIKNRRTS